MRPTPPEVYLQTAADRSMRILSPIPTSTEVKLQWECTLCGRTYSRSLKEMRSVPACRCQAKNAVDEQLYQELGAALGIKWLGPKLPQRTRDETTWLGFDEQKFEAPYAVLSRPNIPRRYRPHLSPTYHAPGSNYEETEHTARLKRIKKGR